jgi:hypothetical protein
MQRYVCNKHSYLCTNVSLKFLFPCENQGVTHVACKHLVQRRAWVTQVRTSAAHPLPQLSMVGAAYEAKV